jgi:anti-anti-sigma regulatory factor
MEIRIDKETEGTDVVLHVAGRLAGDAITQLTDVCEPMEGDYVLDLSKLMFADDAGAEVIRTLRERGADIRGASSFIKLLINGESGRKYEGC